MFEDKINALNESTEQIPITVSYEKRTYTVSEIQEILNIGRNAAYSLVRQNLFHTVKVGSSIRISKKSFDEWLDSCQK